MSGPKVVRIVTREEVIAICEGHLARLDAAIAEWTRMGARNGTIGEADKAAVASRRAALHRMLAEDRFMEVQKQVPQEIAFLRADAQARLERAAAAAAEARRSGRRTARTAQGLLDALAEAGREVPDALRRTLAAADRGGPEVEAAIARAFALLSAENEASGPNARQRALAEALGQGERRERLEDWLARQPPLADDAATLRIDRAIADLAVLAGEDVTAPFHARAVALGADMPPARRALLADSLLLDLAAETKRRREDIAALACLAELAAELARFDSAEARSLRAEIDAALAASEAGQAASLAGRAESLIAAETQAMAGEARRRAVLEGLASLGYEVTQGMATAWVKEGQVVLRNAARPDYGVEIGGGGEASRMQVRVIGFDTGPRDAARDRDMESIWCSEFERLKALVANLGGAIIVEKVLPVGAVPMKTIERSLTEMPDTKSAPSARQVQTR